MTEHSSSTASSSGEETPPATRRPRPSTWPDSASQASSSGPLSDPTKLPSSRRTAARGGWGAVLRDLPASCPARPPTFPVQPFRTPPRAGDAVIRVKPPVTDTGNPSDPVPSPHHRGSPVGCPGGSAVGEQGEFAEPVMRLPSGAAQVLLASGGVVTCCAVWWHARMPTCSA